MVPRWLAFLVRQELITLAEAAWAIEGRDPSSGERDTLYYAALEWLEREVGYELIAYGLPGHATRPVAEETLRTECAVVRVVKLVLVLNQAPDDYYGADFLAAWEAIPTDSRRARLFDLYRCERADDGALVAMPRPTLHGTLCAWSALFPEGFTAFEKWAPTHPLLRRGRGRPPKQFPK